MNTIGGTSEFFGLGKFDLLKTLRKIQNQMDAQKCELDYCSI